VSSPVAGRPTPKLGPYAVGKAAQEALFATLGREVAGTGVTANLVLVRSIRAADAADADPGTDRGTSIAAIAATFGWLCSDEADAVNGARIPLYAA
jgi:NAD(P)-dependent dehydrogenase (short-subunit alcohol dehydrogenase family)